MRWYLALCKTGYFCCYLFCQQAVLASDLVPPPWRGTDGSTFQQWLFQFDRNARQSTEPAICAETTVNKTPWGQRSPPEFIYNPYQQVRGICAEFKSLWPIAQNIDWLKHYHNREGVWKLESEKTFTNFLNFIIPNASADDNASTTIQIQVAYHSPAGNPQISIYTQSIGAPPDTILLTQEDQSDETRLPGDWSQHTAIFRIENCPGIISTFLYPPQQGEVFIDSVTIDTLCSANLD